jgi:alpha-L-rhamnosidase
MWERWDGIRPDGSFQDPRMNSFNHYAYGAIGSWLYQVVAGIEIDPERPGYKHIIFQPHPGGGLTYAKARLESLYGTVRCGWTKGLDGKMVVEVQVPCNTTATLILPKAVLAQVTESGLPASSVAGVNDIRQRGDDVEVGLGSGSYVFSYIWPIN